MQQASKRLAACKEVKTIMFHSIPMLDSQYSKADNLFKAKFMTLCQAPYPGGVYWTYA